jgi:hypothetical protein
VSDVLEARLDCGHGASIDAEYIAEYGAYKHRSCYQKVTRMAREGKRTNGCGHSRISS